MRSRDMTQNPRSAPPVTQAKVVLLGEQGVGKSCMAVRFAGGEFPDRSEATIGAMFITQTVQFKDQNVKFDIWDTAGQERYRTLAPMYYRNAQAAIIVYDITRADTFLRAMSWVEELKDRTTNDIFMVLAGNKVDKDDRVVLAQDAMHVAAENGLVFFETSALTGVGISDIFSAIAQDVSSRKTQGNTSKGVKIEEQKTKVKEKCSC